MNVWIAGARGAVGRVLVEDRRRHGDRVITLDRGASGPHGLAVDLLAPEAVPTLREGATRLGAPDAVVCAVGGWAGGHRFLDAPDGELEAQLGVNLRAPAALVRGLLPGMLERGGCFVFLVSLAAQGAAPRQAAYGAAKAALASLVSSLRVEYAGDGVRFHTLSPGTIDTPANRQAMPDADFLSWVAPGALAGAIDLLFSGNLAPGGADLVLRAG